MSIVRATLGMRDMESVDCAIKTFQNIDIFIWEKSKTFLARLQTDLANLCKGNNLRELNKVSSKNPRRL